VNVEISTGAPEISATATIEYVVLPTCTVLVGVPADAMKALLFNSLTWNTASVVVVVYSCGTVSVTELRLIVLPDAVSATMDELLTMLLSLHGTVVK
jgi:hypothetical protein